MRTLLVAALLSGVAAPQQAPRNGPGTDDHGWHALVHATLIAEPGRTVDDATVVIRGGRVIAVEAGGAAPPGARVWDCSGRHVHAGFVDLHVPVDAPRPRPGEAAAHWNAAVHPQRTALDGDGLTEEVAAELRALGFAVAVIAPRDGVFRGRSAAVTLERPAAGRPRRVLATDCYQAVAFDRAGRGEYPSSTMGAIALIRQTLLDADWHAACRTADSTVAPQAALLALSGSAPLAFAVRDELDGLRAARIAAEFGRSAWLLGSGLEFRRLAAIREAGLPVVVPLDYPAAPDVDSIADQDAVTLRELQTWEQAPTNPRRLLAAGLTVALTTDRLDDRAAFEKNLRRAIRHGLAPAQALAALTTVPARLLGLDGVIGRVAPGMVAHLVVRDGEPFAEESTVRAVWIDGAHHVVEPPASLQLDGAWSAAMRVGGVDVEALRFRRGRLELGAGERTAKARDLRLGVRRLDFVVDLADVGGGGVAAFSAVVEGGRLLGTAIDADGTPSAWTARRAPPETDADEDAEGDGVSDEAGVLDVPDALATPLGAFGRLGLPDQRDVAIRGATVWTSGSAGTIADGTLIVRAGKVAWVGPSAEAPPTGAAVEIDGRGLHVTPGLIDCHSHTGISGGINEGSQAVTSEVRIGDVVNPDDINWYRELAGGLTAVNQLHGSANPIGGQSSVVKLRWGAAHPDEMVFAGAAPGIKFALGENVKRSNSREPSTRYPQTRMGVEMLIRDRFLAARDAVAERARYEALPEARRVRTPPPRRDLELEALAEILAGKRLVHCHSYRQDEILMLCRVAQEFGFRIGTFQHGLEGYKVAESVRAAAIGASIFTDWWAYKFEVFDAIPDNGAIMHEAGVVVSFNSDSNELARRLNTEAAKAVKYGGVPPAAVLQFVTLNPAKQLRADDRIGSLEVGKDGDFAIWSGDPLSTFSKCLQTWIDGRCYFSVEDDRALRAAAEADRRRLIQKVFAADEDARGGRHDAVASDDAYGADNACGDCGCAGTAGGAR